MASDNPAERMQTWHDREALIAAADALASPPRLLEHSECTILDLRQYIDGDRSQVQPLSEALKRACSTAGLFYVRNHGVDLNLVDLAFEQCRAFHSMDLQHKMQLQMNSLGVGYMPINQRKLPTREKGNLNEAFFVKRELGPRNIGLDQNLWPPQTTLPAFRRVCEQYTDALEQLAKALLPIFATALALPEDYFSSAFTRPLYRLRLSHYPSSINLPNHTSHDADQFGIAPHVDTTFITIVAQQPPSGLCFYSGTEWIAAPVIPGTFLVNTGQLLRKWTNDEFQAALHYVRNPADQDRYGVIFFFNADADYCMSCLPTCCSEDRPPKYPAQSYLESEGIVQGE